jgi:hypothetical protein
MNAGKNWALLKENDSDVYNILVAKRNGRNWGSN